MNWAALVSSAGCMCQHCGGAVHITAVEIAASIQTGYGYFPKCRWCNGTTPPVFAAMLAYERIVGNTYNPPEWFKGTGEQWRNSNVGKFYTERRRDRRLWEFERFAGATAYYKFLSLITPKQRRSLRKRGYITVTASTGREYRLYLSIHSNIAEIRKGKIVKGWCYNLGDDIPVFDTMLAQKLALETDAVGFFSKANPQPEEYLAAVGPYTDWKSYIKHVTWKKKTRRLHGNLPITASHFSARSCYGYSDS